MAKLTWDATGERFYETGVSKAVLYPMVENAYPKGYAWNGVTSISEKPTGAEATALYADDTKYLNLLSSESLEASIEAYMYPDEFAACDGSAALDSSLEGVSVGQQNRQAFGLCFKTVLGNDTDGNSKGYKLHLIYGCVAAPSEKGYSTINDSPEAITFSWEVKTTPVSLDALPGNLKPTASIIIDSTKVNPTKLKLLEDALYGTESTEAHLPLPAEVITILKTEG